MRSILLSAAAVAVLSSSAFAAPAQWAVDTGRSKLGFHVVVNGEKVDGTLPFGAVIAFDPADLAHSSIKATVDMTSAKSGNATRDAMLPLPAWFNAKQFPKAQFTTNSITSKGGDAYEAAGVLSLRGISKPVSLPFTLTINGNMAHAVGEATIQRLDYKIGEGKDFAPPTVALDVKVTVDITATRK
ncbi:MAG: polyisoprenoid-binding protein [Alphaproteobacteria bacterium]|nr:polyisoprenoid-binding protein [Alphaproteobacteria bacterium]